MSNIRKMMQMEVNALPLAALGDFVRELVLD
jgi:hypothetical protein